MERPAEVAEKEELEADCNDETSFSDKSDSFEEELCLFWDATVNEVRRTFFLLFLVDHFQFCFSYSGCSFVFTWQ